MPNKKLRPIIIKNLFNRTMLTYFTGTINFYNAAMKTRSGGNAG
jgi:hypothetical protein